MFKKILVPYDGSHHSERAMDTAINMALSDKAALHVLYAYDKLPDYLGEPNFQEVLDRVTAAAQELMESAVQHAHNHGVAATSSVLEGPAAEAILRVAEAEGFDLIIMGSRGLGHLKGLLMGSVSERVMHQAKIPVMIMR